MTQTKPKKLRWHNTFIGVRQQHTYWLYKVIDDILMEHPQILKFVEIGTGGGALSLVLGMHAAQVYDFLLTFDTKYSRHDDLSLLFDCLGINAIEADCFSSLAIKHIRQHIGYLPTFFFCDGDHKAKEMATFTPLLPSGSIIAAHDFEVEFQYSDIVGVIKKYSLEPLHEEEWTGGIDEIQTCFFLKP